MGTVHIIICFPIKEKKEVVQELCLLPMNKMGGRSVGMLM